MNEIKLLKEYRKKHKKSYEQISREIGISMRTVYRWFQKENDIPSPMAREKILAYLKQST
jgi:transcriptional regulator with XRE-family HTH domain